MARAVLAAALLAVIAAIVASLAPAFAEASPGSPGSTLTVRIPFDFRAGGSGFGPGEYVISLNGDASQDGSTAGSVRLESRNRDRSLTIRAQRSRAAGSSAATPAVSFRVYGDQRFLASVHAGKPGHDWELAPSDDEHSASLRWGAPSAFSLKAELRPPSP